MEEGEGGREEVEGGWRNWKGGGGGGGEEGRTEDETDV